MICKFRADFGKYNDARYSSYEFDVIGANMKQCYIIAASRASNIAETEKFDLLALNLTGITYIDEEESDVI